MNNILRKGKAGIAQLVEQLTCNQWVPSSTLGAGTILLIPVNFLAHTKSKLTSQ